MRKEEVESLIFGIDDNQVEAWEKAQKEWNGGTLLMPLEERERRTEYTKMLKKIFLENGISENSFPDDTWLSGKIKRISR